MQVSNITDTTKTAQNELDDFLHPKIKGHPRSVKNYLLLPINTVLTLTVWSFRFSSGSGSVYTRRISFVPRTIEILRVHTLTLPFENLQLQRVPSHLT